MTPNKFQSLKLIYSSFIDRPPPPPTLSRFQPHAHSVQTHKTPDERMDDDCTVNLWRTLRTLCPAVAEYVKLKLYYTITGPISHSNLFPEITRNPTLMADIICRCSFLSHVTCCCHSEAGARGNARDC